MYFSRERLEGAAGTSTWSLEKEGERQYRYQPRYNVAPQQVVPLLRKSAGERVLEPMRWAIPIKDRSASKNEHVLTVINVRAETALEKVSFRKALEAGHRAVVIANGFYEWTASTAAAGQSKVEPKSTSRSPRVPYFIYCGGQRNEGRESADSAGDGLAGAEPLFMAALFIEETEVNRFAIFTVAASAKLEWMHNRMPAILDSRDKLEAWLDADRVSARAAAELCLQPTDRICWHAVSNAVSSVKNDDPSLVQPHPVEKVDKFGLDIRHVFAKVPKRSPSAGALSGLDRKRTRPARDVDECTDPRS